MAKGKKTKNPPGTKEDVERIVGLFLMTFGQGVNPLHVRRKTVQAIRNQLIPAVADAVEDPNWNEQWKDDASTVLGWMAAVGRLAAQIAMEPKDRRTVVEPSDFKIAFDVVLAEHDRGPRPRGKWCR